MIRNGIYATHDLSLVAPRAPASDNHPRRPAPRKQPARDLRVDVHSHLPPAKAPAPKRVSLDGVATKLDDIAASMRTKPRPAVAAVAIEPQRESLRSQLARMNERNRAFWHQ
jgi:hypothetical protein